MLVELIIIYWICSFIAFFLSPLIYKKKLTKAARIYLEAKEPLLMSHRGGMLEQYDNSLSAFKHSIKLNLPSIETDVRKTKDGKFVVIHDQNLERVTGQNKFINETNFNEIGTYKEVVSTDYGLQYKGSSGQSEKVCLLTDLFNLIKNTDIVVSIDVKTGSTSDIDEIADLAKEHSVFDNIILGSSREYLASSLYKKHGNDLNTFFSIYSSITLFILFAIGLLPFIPLKSNFFFTPYLFSDVKNARDLKVSLLYRLVLDFIYMLRPVLRFMFWHLQQRNISVIIFVVNNKEDYEIAKEFGVNVIITDRPELLTKITSN